MAKFVVKFNADKCKGCELCRSVCPKGIIAMGTHVNSKGYLTPVIQRQEDCIGCISCGLMCPDGAIEIFEEEEK